MNKSLSNPDRYSHKFPLNLALSLRYKDNLSYQQIGDKFNCTAQSVFEKIKRFNSISANPDTTKTFREYEADLIIGLRERIFSSIKDEEIEKAPLQTKVWSYGVLFDKSLALSKGQNDQLDYNTMPAPQVVQNIQINIGKLSAIVDRLPVQLRDQVVKLIPQSLAICDNNGESVK